MEKPTDERKLFKRTDLILIGILLTVCVGALLWMYLPKKTAGTVAEIASDGKVVRTISLASAADETFVLPENSKVSFQIKDHQIRFVNTDCPDKLCENVGFLSEPNQLAVCLPNRVSLKIISVGGGSVDAIVN